MSRARALSILLPLAFLAALAAQARPPADPLDELKKELAAAFAKGDVGGAVRVIDAIGSLDSKDAVEVLTSKAVFFHESGQVYDAAKQALARMSSEEAVGAIIKETLKGKTAIRVGLTEVLVMMTTPAVLERTEAALIELLADDDDRVLSPAAVALGKRRSVKAVGPLVQLLKRVEKDQDVVYGEVRQALTDITGEDFPTAREWETWWAVREGSFNPETDRGGKDSATVVRDDPDFFTEQIVSRKIVFIIDVSGSMHIKDPVLGGEAGTDPSAQDDSAGECKVCGQVHRGVNLPDTRQRVERVKRELQKVLKGLKSNVAFNVITFSDKLTPWQRALTKCSGAAKGSAMEFVNKFKAMGATHTDEALRAALEGKQANTIFLLSDGSPFRFRPTEGPIPTEPILEEVRTLNRFLKVKIHTFAFKTMEADPSDAPAVEFMKKLAAEHGGSYHGIN